MTGTFTFDFTKPWQPRSRFLQAPPSASAPTPGPRASRAHSGLKDPEDSETPADWLIVQQKIAATLRNFPDAFEAVRVMLNKHYPEDTET